MTRQGSRPLFRGTVLLLAVVLVSGAVGQSMAATQPGMRSAPKAIAKELLADTTSGALVRCMTVQLAKSSKRCGAWHYRYPAPPGCPGGEAFAVV